VLLHCSFIEILHAEPIFQSQKACNSEVMGVYNLDSLNQAA
jgi:hypothetical protein